MSIVIRVGPGVLMVCPDVQGLSSAARARGRARDKFALEQRLRPGRGPASSTSKVGWGTVHAQTERDCSVPGPLGAPD